MSSEQTEPIEAAQSRAVGPTEPCAAPARGASHPCSSKSPAAGASAPAARAAGRWPSSARPSGVFGQRPLHAALASLRHITGLQSPRMEAWAELGLGGRPAQAVDRAFGGTPRTPRPPGEPGGLEPGRHLCPRTRQADARDGPTCDHTWEPVWWRAARLRSVDPSAGDRQRAPGPPPGTLESSPPAAAGSVHRDFHQERRDRAVERPAGKWMPTVPRTSKW